MTEMRAPLRFAKQSFAFGAALFGGVSDALSDLIPFYYSWMCAIKHHYTEINYRGKIKKICVNCFCFEGGGCFK